MAEPEGDDGDVDSGLEELHGRRVAQPVGVDVHLTYHNTNRLILVEGPEITVRPVATRLPTRDDAQ